MSVIGSNILAGASGQGGYFIDRSLRFRASASAYLNRTPASAGNRKTWTWSAWVKRGALGAIQVLMSSDVGTSVNTWMEFGFDSSDRFYLSSYSGARYTTAVFRDPSAWYHIVCVVDTTQSTEDDRFKLYVNSVLQTDSGDAFPVLNTDYGINNNQIHGIGYRNWASGIGRYFDGYLTEINFIDGQALDPTDFGEYNADTGVWQAKKYTGTYGTNGFYLNFSDNSTTTTLGYDTSGNGNNWTANNISVTSGVTYDSMTDVPTLTSTDAANYAVMNPLDYVAAAFSGTASDGNLTVSIPAPASSNGIASSIKVASTSQTKFYIETTVTSLTTYCSLGMISGTNANYRIRHPNDITINVNDVIMTAFDPATGNLWYGRNGTWFSSGNPAAGTNPYDTIPSTQIVGSAYSIVATNGSTGTFTTKTTFGQLPFAYTPPTGFKALNTYNLPDSTIVDGGEYFNTVLYDGNATARSITGVGFQPDWTWIKQRGTIARRHHLQDAVRTAGRSLFSDATTEEEVNANYLTSFDSDGFSLGTSSETNGTGHTYVAWNWKANGSGVSNTDGSITSTVSANTTAGFSIVTYTGDGNSTATIGHGLGVTPNMVIVKNRDTLSNWRVWHSSLSGSTYYVGLNQTFGEDTSSTVFNGQSSTTFTVGNDPSVNKSGDAIVAYCFADVEGFSKMGSYTGNGSTDGTFVYTGFRPAWLMVKRTDTTASWNISDTTRDPDNPRVNVIYANESSTESDWTAYPADILSNGFKFRTSAGGTNASGGTYIYIAFAENPFKNSLAR